MKNLLWIFLFISLNSLLTSIPVALAQTAGGDAKNAPPGTPPPPAVTEETDYTRDPSHDDQAYLKARGDKSGLAPILQSYDFLYSFNDQPNCSPADESKLPTYNGDRCAVDKFAEFICSKPTERGEERPWDGAEQRAYNAAMKNRRCMVDPPFSGGATTIAQLEKAITPTDKSNLQDCKNKLINKAFATVKNFPEDTEENKNRKAVFLEKLADLKKQNTLETLNDPAIQKDMAASIKGEFAEATGQPSTSPWQTASDKFDELKRKQITLIESRRESVLVNTTGLQEKEYAYINASFNAMKRAVEDMRFASPEEISDACYGQQRNTFIMQPSDPAIKARKLGDPTPFRYNTQKTVVACPGTLMGDQNEMIGDLARAIGTATGTCALDNLKPIKDLAARDATNGKTIEIGEDTSKNGDFPPMSALLENHRACILGDYNPRGSRSLSEPLRIGGKENETLTTAKALDKLRNARHCNSPLSAAEIATGQFGAANNKHVALEQSDAMEADLSGAQLLAAYNKDKRETEKPTATEADIKEQQIEIANRLRDQLRPMCYDGQRQTSDGKVAFQRRADGVKVLQRVIGRDPQILLLLGCPAPPRQYNCGVDRKMAEAFDDYKGKLFKGDTPLKADIANKTQYAKQREIASKRALNDAYDKCASQKQKVLDDVADRCKTNSSKRYHISSSSPPDTSVASMGITFNFACQFDCSCPATCDGVVIEQGENSNEATKGNVQVAKQERDLILSQGGNGQAGRACQRHWREDVGCEQVCLGSKDGDEHYRDDFVAIESATTGQIIPVKCQYSCKCTPNGGVPQPQASVYTEDAETPLKSMDDFRNTYNGKTTFSGAPYKMPVDSSDGVRDQDRIASDHVNQKVDAQDKATHGYHVGNQYFIIQPGGNGTGNGYAPLTINEEPVLVYRYPGGRLIASHLNQPFDDSTKSTVSRNGLSSDFGTKPDSTDDPTTVTSMQTVADQNGKTVLKVTNGGKGITQDLSDITRTKPLASSPGISYSVRYKGMSPPYTAVRVWIQSVRLGLTKSDAKVVMIETEDGQVKAFPINGEDNNGPDFKDLEIIPKN